MRQVPAALAAHLEGSATTTCHAWRLTRRDGVVLGFTEHDRDLVFDGTRFLAASGFQASDTDTGAGLSADGGDVAGAFSHDAITAEDIFAGRYDGAKVEVFLVNWAEPQQHLLLRVQDIGEVTLSGGQFRAELRRMTHRLDQVQGRIYSRRCDATLGDRRCGVKLDGYTHSGVVLAVEDEVRFRTALGRQTGDRFRYGVLTFTTGANAGLSMDVESQSNQGDETVLTLWLPPPMAMAVGDAFTVTAGCDKSFGMCRLIFGNSINFQGFPHMPGPDFAMSYADGETVHDGRPLIP